MALRSSHLKQGGEGVYEDTQPNYMEPMKDRGANYSELSAPKPALYTTPTARPGDPDYVYQESSTGQHEYVALGEL